MGYAPPPCTTNTHCHHDPVRRRVTGDHSTLLTSKNPYASAASVGYSGDGRSCWRVRMRGHRSYLRFVDVKLLDLDGVSQTFWRTSRRATAVSEDSLRCTL
jgi:hypothetical protein